MILKNPKSETRLMKCLGMNETVTINGLNVFKLDSNGEYQLNYDAVTSNFNGFDYSKIKKLYAFQSVNDPVIGPTEETTKELAEIIFRKYLSNRKHQISRWNSGIMNRRNFFLLRKNRNPTQKFKSRFLRFRSQEIGSGLVSLKMIFPALKSELFKFHTLSSKILKIPGLNLQIRV